MTLTDAQREALTARIERRRAELALELKGDAAKLAEDRAGRLNGETADAADRAVADLLGEVDQAEMTRDMNELREYEAALERLKAGTYGECVDCGEPVRVERLEASPAAARCINCQTAWETQHPGDHSPAI